MCKNDKEPRVIDCKADDNQYLHKDFHGVLSYAIKYLTDNYGTESVDEYLTRVAKTYYKPLTEKLRASGLKVLKDHWERIFQLEEGDYGISYEDDVLVLNVKKCPAISHLKERGQLFTEDFCRSTVVVNEVICGDAGYECSCEYKPGEGRCIQKFWKSKGEEK